ncbi:MAG TPA: hypothetical protein VM842_04570 [Nitrospira sp.]|nr:hypothetical protein [Nitrospira sp.]
MVGEPKTRIVEALQLGSEPVARSHHFDLPVGSALEFIADANTPLSVLSIADYNTKGLGGVWDGTGEHDHFGRLVVNLGVDDKADVALVTGGSFGFGKTVYGKASRIGVVCFYSVFSPTEASEGSHARFMATGLFKAHETDTGKYDGFAFFGAPHPLHADETLPLEDEAAHAMAGHCGMEIRSPHEFGTTILILDCDYDIHALKTAVENFWWPRLVRNELDVTLICDEQELAPRPKQNNDIKPFIKCYQNIVSESSAPPKEMLFKGERRIGTSEGSLQAGTLSAVLLEGDSAYSNCAALVRGPGMVVAYHQCGMDSYESCVGMFNAHPDVEKFLTFSEPQMHDRWDPNADRLLKKFGPDGPKVVTSVLRRLETHFRDFQRKQEPPLPPGGLKARELMKLLGRFLDVPGVNPNPPPKPDPRPISISVTEDRVQGPDGVWDEAIITLDIKPEIEAGVLNCTVSAMHEVLGDASLRLIERSECRLQDSDGKLLAVGVPPVLHVTLTKGKSVKLVARAATDEIAVTRLRVAVEEVQ